MDTEVGDAELMQHVWQEEQTTQTQKIFAGSTWELECGTVFPTVQFSIVCTTFAMVLAKMLQKLQLNF